MQETRGVLLLDALFKGDTPPSAASAALTPTLWVQREGSGRRGGGRGRERGGGRGRGAFWGTTCSVPDQGVAAQLCSLGDNSLGLHFGLMPLSALVRFFN